MSGKGRQKAGLRLSNGAISYFEGTEKKLELSLDRSESSLRRWPRAYWERLVDSVGARIVSSVGNQHCDAFLLSESSLFVYDRRLILITCGKTRLTEAVPLLLERIDPEQIDLLIYERKNEVFPHEQPSSFAEDAASIHRLLPGRAYQFGQPDEHHLYVFQLDRTCAAIEPDLTVELLMYGLGDRARASFQGGRGGRSALAGLGLARDLDGFDMDDHDFQPSGYSLNAIRDDRYATLHVTPERLGSYASFETNAEFRGGVGPVLQRCLEGFAPRAFDLIVWERGTSVPALAFDYDLRSRFVASLPCGYRVRFESYGERSPATREPIELPLHFTESPA